ncbi:hypothetical protein ABK040_005219 [Willaertia magna]
MEKGLPSPFSSLISKEDINNSNKENNVDKSINNMKVMKSDRVFMGGKEVRFNFSPLLIDLSSLGGLNSGINNTTNNDFNYNSNHNIFSGGLTSGSSLSGTTTDTSETPSTTPLNSNTTTGTSKFSPLHTNSTNYHDYSSSSEQSFDFLYDYETDAGDHLKTLLLELDNRLNHFPLETNANFSRNNKRASKHPAASIRNKNSFRNLTNSLKYDNVNPLESFSKVWSKHFPHLGICATRIKDDKMIHGSSPNNLNNLSNSNSYVCNLSPFGGIVEEVIAEDGEYKEVFVENYPSKVADENLDEFTIMITDWEESRKSKHHGALSPLSSKLAEKTKVLIKRGFPPIEPLPAFLFEIHWTLFDKIWKHITPKLMECYKEYIKTVELKRQAEIYNNDYEDIDNNDSNPMNDGFDNDNSVEEIINEESSEFEMISRTPLSRNVHTAMSISSVSSRGLTSKQMISSYDVRQKNQQGLNSAVRISSIQPKPRKRVNNALMNSSSFKNNNPNNNLPSSRENRLNNVNSGRGLESHQKQQQFPARHHPHFTGGFRANPLLHSPSAALFNMPKPTTKANKLLQQDNNNYINNNIPNKVGERAQTALPSSLTNKLLMLEKDQKSKVNNVLQSSRPPTQSKVFVPTDNVNINRMEQFSQDNPVTKRSDLSSPPISNTVTYSRQRGNSKIHGKQEKHSRRLSKQHSNTLFNKVQNKQA